MGAIGGALGGGGSTTTTQNTNQISTNFAPFQSGAIGSVFDVLGSNPSLLQVPELAEIASTNALQFGNDLLTGATGAQQDLLNFGTLINEDIGNERFNDAIDRFETIGNRAGGAFAPFIDRAAELAESGIDPRAGELLFETAQRGGTSNPFIDALVGDVSTDVTSGVLDEFIGSGSGGLEASAAPEAVARAIGRESRRIRFDAFESEANRALQAQQALGQFDATNASQQLNAAIAGGNLTNQRFGVELGAAGGVLQGTQAEVARRNALLGLRAQNEQALANLQLAGVNAIPGLSRSLTELPFVPLSNFSEIAFAPLGQNVQGTTVGETEQEQGLLGTLGQVAGLGLTAAGLATGNPFSIGTSLTGPSSFRSSPFVPDPRIPLSF